MTSEERPVVLYHGGCYDGFCAAWVAAKRYPGAELRPVMHGTRPPDDLAGRHVLMLDFCFARPDMVALCRAAASVRVFDHHVTARDSIGGLALQMAAEGRDVEITFDLERSGCGITWDELLGWASKRPAAGGDPENWSSCSECHGHLNGHPYHDPGCPARAPWLVRYIEDRDLWRWALPYSREINAYVSTLPYGTPADLSVWSVAADVNLAGAIEWGRVALQAQQRYAEAVCPNAVMRDFGEWTVPSLNVPQHGISEVLDHLMDLHPDAPFVHGWWQRGGDGRFAHSLRSRGEFDVSKLALNYGGGGHKNAAGFQTRDAPGTRLVP